MYIANYNFFSGALTLAIVLLYPKKLGGGAVFSGWVPFNSSMIEKFPEDAKKVLFFIQLVYLVYLIIYPHSFSCLVW